MVAIQKQSQEEIQAWLENFHHVADALTTTDLHKFYTKDSVLRFANNEPVIGLDNISTFFESVFPLLESMKHRLVDFDVVGNKIFLACTITYEVKNDPKKEKFMVPGMGVFYLTDEGEVAKFEVYIDASAVFARIGEVVKA